MKERIKRLDAANTHALVLDPAERELILEIKELVRRVNDLAENVSTLKGENRWDAPLMIR